MQSVDSESLKTYILITRSIASKSFQFKATSHYSSESSKKFKVGNVFRGFENLNQVRFLGKSARKSTSKNDGFAYVFIREYSPMICHTI